MKEHIDKMLALISESAGSGPVQLHHLFKACTSDVITMYAFGDSFRFLEEKNLGRPYFEATDLFFGLTHLFGHATWLAVLIQSLPIWAVAFFIPQLRELWSKQSVSFKLVVSTLFWGGEIGGIADEWGCDSGGLIVYEKFEILRTPKG